MLLQDVQRLVLGMSESNTVEARNELAGWVPPARSSDGTEQQQQQQQQQQKKQKQQPKTRGRPKGAVQQGAGQKEVVGAEQ